MASQNSENGERRNDWLFVATKPEATIVARKDSVSYCKRVDEEFIAQDGNESEPEFEILSSFQCIPGTEDDFTLPFPATEPAKFIAEEKDGDVNKSNGNQSDDDILIISNYFSENKDGFECELPHNGSHIHTDTEQDSDRSEGGGSDTGSVIGLCELIRILEEEEFSSASGNNQIGDFDNMSENSQDFEVVDECDAGDLEPVEIMESSVSTSMVSGCSEISVHYLFEGFGETSSSEREGADSHLSGYQDICDIDNETEVGDESFGSSDTSSFDLLAESDIEKIDDDDDDDEVGEYDIDDENFIFKINLFDESDGDKKPIKQQTHRGNGLSFLQEEDQTAEAGFIQVDIPTFLILLCLTTALGFSIGHGINAYLSQRGVRVNGGKYSLIHREPRIGLDIGDKANGRYIDNPSRHYFTYWTLQQEIAEGEELLEGQREQFELSSLRRKLQNDHYRLLQSYEDLKQRLHVTKVMSWYWRTKYENKENKKNNENSSETIMVKKLQNLEVSYAREKRLADLWRGLAERRNNADMNNKPIKQSFLERSRKIRKVFEACINTQKYPAGCISLRKKSKLSESHQGYCNSNLTGFKNRWIVKGRRKKNTYKTSVRNGPATKKTLHAVQVVKALKISQEKSECPNRRASYSSAMKLAERLLHSDQTLSNGETANIKHLVSDPKFLSSERTKQNSPLSFMDSFRKSNEYTRNVPTKKIEVCKFCSKSYTRGPEEQNSTILKVVRKNQKFILSSIAITQSQKADKSEEIFLNKKSKTYEKLYVVDRNGYVNEIILYGPISHSDSISNIKFHPNGSLAEITWSTQPNGLFLSVLSYKPNSGNYEEIRRHNRYNIKNRNRVKSSKSQDVSVITCKNGTVLQQAKNTRRKYSGPCTMAYKKKGETSMKKHRFKLRSSFSNASGSRQNGEKRKKKNRRRREFLINKIRTLLVKKRQTKDHERQLKKRFKKENLEMKTKRRNLKEQKAQIRKELKLLKRQKREFENEKKHYEEKLEKKLKELERKLKREQNRLEKWKEKEEKELKRTLRKDWEKLKLKQKKTEKKRVKEIERIKKDLTRKKKKLGEREKKLEKLRNKLETNYRKWAKKLWEKIKEQQLAFERWGMSEKERKKAKLKEQKQKELEKVIAAQLRYERIKGKQKQTESLRTKLHKKRQKLRSEEKKQDFKDWKSKRMKDKARKKRKRRYWKELERLQQWLLQVEEQKLEQEREVVRKCPRKTPIFGNTNKKSSRSNQREFSHDHDKDSVQERNKSVKRKTSLIETKEEHKNMTLFDANFTLLTTGNDKLDDGRQGASSAGETGAENGHLDTSSATGSESDSDADVVVEIDEVGDGAGPIPPTWLPRRCVFPQFCDKPSDQSANEEKLFHRSGFQSPFEGPRKRSDWYLQRALGREASRQESNVGPVPPDAPKIDWYHHRIRGREELHQKLIFGPWKEDISRSVPDWYYLRSRGREKLHRKSISNGFREEPVSRFWYARRVKGRARDRHKNHDTWFLERGYNRQNAREEGSWEDYDQNVNWFLHRVKGRAVG